jgi:hypothetical protein
MGRPEGRYIQPGLGHKAPAAATADLATLAARRACFVGCPFMSRAFFMRGATAFAGYLALLVD